MIVAVMSVCCTTKPLQTRSARLVAGNVSLCLIISQQPSTARKLKSPEFNQLLRYMDIVWLVWPSGWALQFALDGKRATLPPSNLVRIQ